MQQIIDMNDNNRQLFTFIETTYETHEQLNEILHDEKRNPQLSDLAQGLVFRCHIIYYKQMSSDHVLSDDDLLIFNFHHALFDFSSMNIFLHDLNQAYTTGQLLYDNNTLLRYLDYAVIEQQMSMTGASMFWLDALHDCKLDQSLSLPFDRYRPMNEHRTGRGTSISFDFGQDLSYDYLIHASSNNISVEHLTFAIYFIFLFKLTNAQTDLCLAMNINNNRYRDEFKSIIGLFENIIPLRCQLDPHWCFHQLLEHAPEIIRNSLKYSYFPLQRILDQHPHISKHAFLDTSLEFISSESNNGTNAIMIGDSRLVSGPFPFKINEDEMLSIMAIEMSGSVYCPLSPRDPQNRLHTLIEQTQSRCVLVHHLTKIQFDDDIISLDIDLVLTNIKVDGIVHIDELSNVLVAPDTIVYIVFTSGSTGTPKAAQVLHQNFIQLMHSLVRDDVLNEHDIIMQIARCSFDLHIQDIIGTLITGASLVMLHLGGTIDFDYLIEVIKTKTVTYFTTVPTMFQHLFSLLQKSNKLTAIKTLRSLCSGGDICSVNLVHLILSSVPHSCRLWNLYGPAEATIVSTSHKVHIQTNVRNISIGRPLFNYRCIIINQYLQSSTTAQEGELFIGGVGVFAGYLRRDDLTAKALVEIDGQLFYRTGDHVTMDNHGLLYYQGRKDHQIKLHGQRIELGEIERCLLSITSLSGCVVMKWKDDYLVAYVQSFDVNEQELRAYCQSHLPPHMIPSIFIILNKLPLNQNGKIDRKQLPSPVFSSSTLLSSYESNTPLNQFEERIHTIWCQVLHSNQNQISTTTSFFSAGGHSLRFIELYYRYQSLFSFDAHSLSIGLFLQQPTIRQHAQLLQTLPSNDTQATRCQILHINQGKTSLN
ncbi:unnamed protein product [Adineta steineri]|uniref:Carrier domain-containing protein n=1 Tax=Adineta steineri TaxID=433720 RepID=A0A815LBT3_9BILA|nr:unnamed protein product [Adineta steineri]CAF1616496.1 unnamed protein product [Adineta steineri]